MYYFIIGLIDKLINKIFRMHFMIKLVKIMSLVLGNGKKTFLIKIAPLGLSIGHVGSKICPLGWEKDAK